MNPLEKIRIARKRMERLIPGEDQWWIAFYDLRKAESELEKQNRTP